MERELPGVDAPVVYPSKRLLWGVEKPRGCTPASEGRNGDSRQFSRQADAGPFSGQEALDHIRAQQRACCAAAS